MGDLTQTGLRMPSELSDKLEAKAKEIGVSKNAFVLILLNLGWRAYENVTPQRQAE
jgi:predicted DNA-binding protein